MTPQPKKVCVVGAGMSGLAAARELQREGLVVTVMEQCGDVGGQWLYDPRTDADDPLGAAAPVKVHSSMYASMRLMSPRECMGFSDFQFVPRPAAAAGRDARRYPGHREVYCYLKDFVAAFGLADAVRLNTRVLRVAMAPPLPRDEASRGGGAGGVKWLVRSVRVDPDGGEEASAEDVEEVFDAVVIASGHYSEPRLPSIRGMEMWRRRQLHSHSYRTPEPFRGEVVVVVGCGESGLDIATELCGVAKEVHLVAKSMDDASAPAPAVAKLLTNHPGIRLRPPVDRLCDDGTTTTVEFADGSGAAADTVIYCTGYRYSFPFLDTAGAVAVDGGGRRVGPLYEHTFPPALAPSLSFVGVPMRIFAPWFFEAQARWFALVLAAKAALPPETEMMRAVEKDYRARELAGVPAHLAHVIGAVERSEIWEFVYRHTDLPRMEGWKAELFEAGVMNSMADRETFRDLDDDSETVREGLQRWRLVAGAQYEAALAAAAACSGDQVHADVEPLASARQSHHTAGSTPNLHAELSSTR